MGPSLFLQPELLNAASKRFFSTWGHRQGEANPRQIWNTQQLSLQATT